MMKRWYHRSSLIRTYGFLTLLVGLFAMSTENSSAANASKKDDTTTEVSREVWAGHQVVFGEKKIPVLGSRTTRSDSYVIAEVTRNGKEIKLTQRSCKVEFNKVVGVQVSMSNKSLAELPPAQIVFEITGKNGQAKPWSVGWGSQDIDRDGAPGASVTVYSPLCKGKIYVASNTQSRARGILTEYGMKGRISVTVNQEILGANSRCLRWFSDDSTETQHGTFAYRKVPPGTTCDSLLKAGWPVRAKTAGKNGK